MKMKALWQPNPEKRVGTQIVQFMTYVNKQFGLELKSFRDLHLWSTENIGEFWSKFAAFFNVIFHEKPQKTFEPKDSFFESRFFTGATINFAENLLRHTNNVEKLDSIAIVSELENGASQAFTWRQLGQHTHILAQYLKERQFKKGQSAAACLPNFGGTIVSMLAATSQGGVFSSASPDFGPEALLDRFGQINPHILFVCDGYYFRGRELDIREKMTTLIKSLPSVSSVVVFDVIGKGTEFCEQLKQAGVDVVAAHTLFSQITQATPVQPSYIPITFQEPVYIMFSSGTTGKPKCMAQGPGVLLNQIKEHLLHNDMQPSDTLFYYTTCGWMMWNWMAAGLFTGGRLALFDGNPLYPGPKKLFDFCEHHHVSIFGTSARYLQALQQFKFHHVSDKVKQRVRLLLSTGSPLPADTFEYIHENLLPQTQICSISGGTDLNGCFVLGNPLEPVYAGEIQCAGLGLKVNVYGEDGQPTNQEGELVCEAAFPAMPLFFVGDVHNERYKSSYFAKFKGVWHHGDFITRTPNGGFVISGRSDATLNPGGVRMGTAEIYRVVENIEIVQDSLAVGVPINGDVAVVLFVVLHEQNEDQSNDKAIQLIKNTIRTKLSPRHTPSAVFFVREVPLTTNGKKSEIAVKNILSGKEVTNRDALQNPAALDYFIKNRAEILQKVSAR